MTSKFAYATMARFVTIFTENVISGWLDPLDIKVIMHTNAPNSRLFDSILYLTNSNNYLR